MGREGCTKCYFSTRGNCDDGSMSRLTPTPTAKAGRRRVNPGGMGGTACCCEARGFRGWLELSRNDEGGLHCLPTHSCLIAATNRNLSKWALTLGENLGSTGHRQATDTADASTGTPDWRESGEMLAGLIVSRPTVSTQEVLVSRRERLGVARYFPTSRNGAALSYTAARLLTAVQ